jgi:hypothetical protein
MLFGLKPNIWHQYLDQIEIRRDAVPAGKIAIAVSSAIKAAAAYVRANPYVVGEWTVGDYRDGFSLTDDECAELRAIIHKYNLAVLAVDLAGNFEEEVDVAEAVDWVRRAFERGLNSDSDIRMQAAQAAEDGVWCAAFMDCFPFNEHHRHIMKRAEARLEARNP